MANPLKEWRRGRREAGYWQKARDRSGTMTEPAIVNEIDTAIMYMGQMVSRYRSGIPRENQLDQLLELRLQLEACLGMLENVIPD